MINLEKKVAKVLKIVKKYKKYLTKPENLPQLAKIMKSWDKLFYSVRVAYGMKYNLPNNDCDKWLIEANGWCEDNPKYAILDDDELNDDLIYDAWCVDMGVDYLDIPYYWEFPELFFREVFFAKSNKTMDDWQEFFNKCYPSICSFRKSFLSNMLCCIGTGRDWTKDGYIDHGGPSGMPENIYGFWRQAKINPKIAKELDTIFKIPEMEIVYKTMIDSRIDYKNSKKHIVDELEAMLSDIPSWKEEKAKHKAEEERKRIEEYKYYPISEGYSPILCIPTNAHESYIKAAIEACNDILSSSLETKSNKECATKVLKNLKEQHEKVYSSCGLS